MTTKATLGITWMLIAVLALVAYYLGYASLRLLSMFGGPRLETDGWWVAWRAAIGAGMFLSAISVTLIMYFGSKGWTWRERAIVLVPVTALVIAQPFVQLTMLRRATMTLFEQGQAETAPALATLGVAEALPAMVERIRAVESGSFSLAESALRLPGGPAQVRAIALDRTARPDARWTAALAIETTSYDHAMTQVIDELIREKDPEFRAVLPQRLEAFKTRSNHLLSLFRGPLLLDPDPRLRLVALKGAGTTEPAFCRRITSFFDDVDRDVRHEAFRYLEWCFQNLPENEVSRGERVTIYRAAILNPDPEISKGAAQGLAKLGAAR